MTTYQNEFMKHSEDQRSNLFWHYYWTQTNNPMQWSSFYKYISKTPSEALQLLAHNGMKGVMEVLIKNWCEEYFGEPFELPLARNEKGFDIHNKSNTRKIEVKTAWASVNPTNNSNIVGFGNLVSKRGLCSHVLFYNGFNDANAFYLFAHDEVYDKLQFTGTEHQPQIRYSPVFTTRRVITSKCYNNSKHFLQRRITL